MKRISADPQMVDSIRKTLDGPPHLHGRPDGFVRLEMIRPVNAPDEVWLMTYWQDRDAYQTFCGLEAGQTAAVTLPSGGGVQYFEHLAS